MRRVTAAERQRSPPWLPPSWTRQPCVSASRCWPAACPPCCWRPATPSRHMPPPRPWRLAPSISEPSCGLACASQGLRLVPRCGWRTAPCWGPAQSWSPPVRGARSSWIRPAPGGRSGRPTASPFRLRCPPTPASVLEEGAVHTVNRPVADDEPTDGLFTFSMVTAGGVSTVGSTFLPSAPDPESLAPQLVAHGARFVPSLAGAAIVRSRVCARPQSVDGRPFIGPVNGLDGVFVTAGHGPWGISTGPASASLVIATILDGEPIPPELAGNPPRLIRCDHGWVHLCSVHKDPGHRTGPWCATGTSAYLGWLHKRAGSPTDDRHRGHGVGAHLDRAGHAHDTGAGALLRRPCASQERAQHDHAQLLHARAGQRDLGAVGLHPGLRARCGWPWASSARCNGLAWRV